MEAVAEAEGIEVSDEELLDALGPTAEREGVSPGALRDRLAAQGRLEELRAEVRSRKAIDVVADSATPIPLGQAEAREKLWTPGKEAPGEPEQGAEEPTGQLWTPGR